MKILILLCIIGITFVIIVGQLSKDTSSAPSDPDADFARLAVYAVKKSQRNPESFALEKLLLTEKAVCMEWRGQNGFGGMNRGHSVIARDKSYALNDHENGFNRAWNRDCANKQGRDLTQHMQGELRYNSAMSR